MRESLERPMMSKTILITGATSGIGAAVSRKILEEASPEDTVWLNYGHDDAKARAFVEKLPEQKKKQVCLLKADLSSYEEMCRAAARLREQSDSLDWLVLNTGISEKKPFEQCSFEEWNRVIQTNLSIPAFLVQELLPVMNPGGSILFTGSYAGQQAYSSSIVYGVSKAGVHFLARSLVKVLEPKGIRVNAIAPGFIETPWHEKRTRESYDRINRKIALHRFGSVAEVADMAYAVLSNEYMNGSVIELHGGYDYF